MIKGRASDLAQFRLSLALLATLCFTCLIVGLLANFSPVMSRHIAQENQRHRETNGVYYFNAGYSDAEDYVLVGQIPRDDFSRGGVYFFGASTTVISIMPWELPPEERKLIHNYALGDISHKETLYFLRSLVEEQGLLQAGGEKTTVVLCLFYGMARRKPDPNHFLTQLFPRHGFYTYDSERGIHRVPMSSVEGFIRRQHVYVRRFLHILTGPPSRVIPPVEQPDPAKHQAAWVKSIGPGWQEEMQVQARDLAALLDYLRERNVRIKVIFAPLGSWQHGLPFNAAYRDLLRPILDSRQIPVTDMSGFVPDEDFGDATHLRYSGQQKVHRAYRELALQALTEMGTRLEP